MLIRLFTLLSLAALCAPVVLYLLLTDSEPAPIPAADLATDQLYRVQQKVNQQQARIDENGQVHIELTEGELNTALNLALAQQALPLHGNIYVELNDGAALVYANIELPLKIERRFVPVKATGISLQGLPQLTEVRIGKLPLPQSLVESLDNWLKDNASLGDALAMAWQALDSMTIAKQSITFSYGEPNALQQGIEAAKPDGPWRRIDVSAVEEQLQLLAAVVDQQTSKRQSLLTLLVPAFELAVTRSQAGGDPVAENMAAIVAVALYGAAPQVMELSKLDDRFGYPITRPELRLHRRKDLSNHWITSAIISLYAGEQLAAMLGMQKELEDSGGYSGFDFSDLIADKAGIRFAELATSSEASARLLQQRVIAIKEDDELLPNPRKLPDDGITEKLANLDERERPAFLRALDEQAGEQITQLPFYRTTDQG